MTVRSTSFLTDVLAICTTRASHTEALFVAKSLLLFVHWSVCAAYPSEKSIQSAIQHASRTSDTSNGPVETTNGRRRGKTEGERSHDVPTGNTASRAKTKDYCPLVESIGLLFNRKRSLARINCREDIARPCFDDRHLTVRCMSAGSPNSTPFASVPKSSRHHLMECFVSLVDLRSLSAGTEKSPVGCCGSTDDVMQSIIILRLSRIKRHHHLPTAPLSCETVYK